MVTSNLCKKYNRAFFHPAIHDDKPNSIENMPMWFQEDGCKRKGEQYHQY
jgi:hypothetical protein